MCRDKRSQSGSSSAFSFRYGGVRNQDAQHVVVRGAFVPVDHQNLNLVLVRGDGPAVGLAAGGGGVGGERVESGAEIRPFESVVWG